MVDPVDFVGHHYCLFFTLLLLFQLYNYSNEVGEVFDPRFYDRLHWNGSKDTEDLQDGSIYILNVTFNDTGTYFCMFDRILMYTNLKYPSSANKTIVLNVVPRRKLTSLKLDKLTDKKHTAKH